PAGALDRALHSCDPAWGPVRRPWVTADRQWRLERRIEPRRDRRSRGECVACLVSTVGVRSMDGFDGESRCGAGERLARASGYVGGFYREERVGWQLVFAGLL